MQPHPLPDPMRQTQELINVNYIPAGQSVKPNGENQGSQNIYAVVDFGYEQ
jgi:hypothetical protein